jgi:hypothetical protein
MFPDASARAGMYESFYLRAFSPHEPVGVWIRHTVHKAPGASAHGSLWCTVFDARLGRPFMHKLTVTDPTAPSDAWIAIGEHATMARDRAEGSCGPARWSLRFGDAEPELRHLTPEILYRAPLPRTKLTSPAPVAQFNGSLELDGREPIELRNWPGMVGHNWGTEHAERWIWLHGCAFAEEPQAWIDVALGRVRVAGRLTPWVASGAISLGGRRVRIGGLRARGLQVTETVDGCTLTLPGADGLELGVRADVPSGAQAGWRYADPAGPKHDVVNCSISALELDVRSGERSAPLRLTSAHGGAYELGMREHDHGVPLAPFEDG